MISDTSLIQKSLITKFLKLRVSPKLVEVKVIRIIV